MEATCRISLPVRALCALLVFLWMFGFYQSKMGVPLTPPNPTRYIAEASQSLWITGTLKVARYEAVYNNLLDRSRSAPEAFFWQDVFAVGVDGSLWPLRGISMAILAAPFWGVAGELGLWLFNVVSVVLVLVCYYKLSRQIASPVAALAATATVLLGTSLIYGTYGFSHDIFLCTCLLGAFVTVSRFPVCAALALLLAIETKQFLLVFSPAIYFYAPPKARPVFVITFCLLLVALCFWQWQTWGAPFAVSYDRVCYFRGGAAHIHRPVELSWEILLRDWANKLGNTQIGLFPTNPALVIAVLGWITVPASFLKRYVWALIASCLTMMLIYSLRFSYIEGVITEDTAIWDLFGNAARYCLPSVLLISVSVSAVFERFLPPFWFTGQPHPPSAR